MEQEQELIRKYVESYCSVHKRVTRFLLTEDAENHIICNENNCSFRKILKELPQDIKTIELNFGDL